MKRSNRSFPSLRLALLAALAFACLAPLPAAELHVRGLNWFANRKAEQRLKLLLGAQHGATLDAAALEDAALVLIGSLNDEGYLEPGLTVKFTGADGAAVAYPLDARIEHPLPRPLAVTEATLHITRGQRFALQDVTFTGLQALTAKDARAFFSDETMLIPLVSERIYSPGRLHRAMGNLEEALRQLGYAEVAVTLGTVAVNHDNGEVRARVIVEEGRRWVVDALH